MVRYLFIAVGFPTGGSGRQTRTKLGKRQHKRRNNTQNNENNNIKKHRIHQNRKRKHKTENKHRKNIKKY